MSDTAYVVEWLLMGFAIAAQLVMLVMCAYVVLGFVHGKIDALDLVRGKTGRISDEKMWTHVGKGLLVFAMLKDASDGNPNITLQVTLFTAIAAHEVVIRWMASKEPPRPMGEKTA